MFCFGFSCFPLGLFSVWAISWQRRSCFWASACQFCVKLQSQNPPQFYKCPTVKTRQMRRGLSEHLEFSPWLEGNFLLHPTPTYHIHFYYLSAWWNFHYQNRFFSFSESESLFYPHVQQWDVSQPPPLKNFLLDPFAITVFPHKIPSPDNSVTGPHSKFHQFHKAHIV